MSKFRLPVHRALEAGLDAELTEVVVIGITEDDEVIVISSTSANDTIDIIERGSEETQISGSDDDA